MTLKQSIVMRGIVCASLLASSALYAGGVCESRYGTMQCGAGTIDRVDYMGGLEIDGTTITKPCDVLGNATVSRANLNDLNIHGELKINNTTVAGRLHVTGQVNMRESELKNDTKITGNYFGNHIIANAPIEIVGSTECDKCTFKQAVTMVGEANIDSSEFMSSFTLVTRNAVLSGTKAIDIDVKKASESGDQHITLKSGSIVRNITFETGRGYVYLKSGAKVIGKVEGGKIVS